MKQTVRIALATALLGSTLALQGCPPQQAGTPSSSPAVSAAPGDTTTTTTTTTTTPGDTTSSTTPATPGTPSTTPATGTPAVTAAPVSTAAPVATAAPVVTTAVKSFVVPISMDAGKVNAYLSEKDGRGMVLVNFDNVDPTPTLVYVKDTFGNTVSSTSSFSISGSTGNASFTFQLNGFKLTDLTVGIKTTNNTKVFEAKVNATNTVDATPTAIPPTGTPVPSSNTSTSTGSTSSSSGGSSNSGVSGAA